MDAVRRFVKVRPRVAVALVGVAFLVCCWGVSRSWTVTQLGAGALLSAVSVAAAARMVNGQFQQQLSSLLSAPLARVHLVVHDVSADEVLADWRADLLDADGRPVGQLDCVQSTRFMVGEGPAKVFARCRSAQMWLCEGAVDKVQAQDRHGNVKVWDRFPVR